MEKFYLGMDIGTESVGMACTDENYNLLRAKGKDLWAVRLFDEAKDASERRAKRSARRRLARRRQRIDWLQEIFAPFMEDSLFFIRLNNSGFYENDKDAALKTRFSVFADKNYTDKEFHAQFPTIFHLRKALIEGKVITPDLRLYYLALHHIIKYRGHFLFEGESSYSRDIEKLFEKFNETALENFSEIVVKLPTDKAKDFRSLALERLGFNDKKKAAFSLLCADTEAEKGFVTLILGGTVKATALFGDEYEEYKGEKLCFQNISEEDFQAKGEIFGDNFYILEVAHEIYNFIRFEKILNGKENISSAMVALYDKHKSDLNKLKRLIKTQCPDLYYKLFRSTEEKANYVNYIGYTKSKAVRKKAKKCGQEDFYKFIKKILDENQGRITDKTTFEEIKSDIENQSFLPKILITTLEAVPVLVDYNLHGDNNKLLEYLRNSGLKEPKILVEKIKIKSLVSVNGFKCWIAGKTGKQILLHNANQWFTSFETDRYVKDIVKLLEQERKGQISEEEKQSECFNITVIIL